MLLLDLFLVGLGAVAGAAVCRRFGVPEVLGYLAAGVLLGPYAHATSFVENVDAVRTLATFAVVFRMFTLGLDFDARRLAGRWKPGLLAGGLEMGLCTFAGIGVAAALGWPLLEGAVLGAALGTTSTSILSKALADRNMGSREDARAAGAATLVEDLIAMTLLAFLAVFHGASGPAEVVENALALLVFAALALTAGAILVPAVLDRLGRSHQDELTMVSVVAILFGFAALSELLGAGRPVGAFLAGIAVGAARHGPGVSARILPLRDVLVAVAYVTIGLFLDPRVIVQVAPIALLVALLFVPLKVTATAIGLRLGGTPTPTAARAGAILGQAGTMGLVFACTPLLTPEAGARLMAMAFVAWAFTVALTPLRLRYLPDAAERIARALGASDRIGGRAPRLTRGLDADARAHAGAAVVAAGCALAFAALGDLAAMGARFAPGYAKQAVLVFVGVITALGMMSFAFVVATQVGHLSHAGIHRVALRPGRLSAGRRDDARRWSGAATLGALAATLVAGCATTWSMAPADGRWWLAGGAFLATVTLALRQSWLLRLADAGERLVMGRQQRDASRLTDFRGMGPFGFDVEALIVAPGTRPAWATLGELPLRAQTGAQVVALVRPGRPPETLAPATQVHPGDELVLGGTPTQLEAAKRWLLEPASPRARTEATAAKDAPAASPGPAAPMARRPA